MAKLISKVYGDALFDYALENNLIEQTYEEASDINYVFKTSKELRDFVSNPIISTDEKKKTLNNIFIENVWKGTLAKVLSVFKLDSLVKGKDTKILSFLYIIIDKGREREINSIMEYFLARVREYKNIGVAYVTSATPLKDSQKKLLEEKLINTTNYKQFIFEYEVDEELISGVKIVVGDKVIDSTIKTKINTLSKNLRGV